MKPGVVFIGEDFDDREPASMWPGRWSAHWESDDGQEWTQGPKAVSAQEAIAWGREHADIVQIRPGDSGTVYSAGIRPPSGKPDCPRWPDNTELLRRRTGTPTDLDPGCDGP
jgi:hypothetical protein